MERQHLTLDEMNRAVGLLQAGVQQTQLAEQLGVSQSVVSRLWRRFRDTGSPAEQRPGRGRSTTAAQDGYLVLTARRQPTITAPELVNDIQRGHNVTIGSSTMRHLDIIFVCDILMKRTSYEAKVKE
ncbi:homeobox-like domain superfamily [Holotrichia oblita]|uniref:Homeobox-like domain superfamily n=1 Tax=Holotrichia oblita TaxID=644536 RepID=A0ACB9TE26_HOLOL|nr:homeobox-like domain superfamily [Holotrichia oblita]